MSHIQPWIKHTQLSLILIADIHLCSECLEYKHSFNEKVLPLQIHSHIVKTLFTHKKLLNKLNRKKIHKLKPVWTILSNYLQCCNSSIKYSPRIAKNPLHASIIWIAVFHVILTSPCSSQLFFVI